MVTHAVQLDTLAIVDVHVLVLSNSEHRVILKETDIPYLVLGVELHDKVFIFPFQHGQVTFLAPNEDMLAIFRDIKG